jgi:hypothetical protein
VKQAFAVTGYVPTEAAEQLRQKTLTGLIEVRPDANHHEVVARVNIGTVADVRIGPSAGGSTLVQLILTDGATVETVTRIPAGVKGLSLLDDPILNRLQQAATAKEITV